MKRRSFLQFLGLGAASLPGGVKVLESWGKGPHRRALSVPDYVDLAPTGGIHLKDPVDRLDQLPCDAEKGDAVYVHTLDRLYIFVDHGWIQIVSAKAGHGLRKET